MIRQVRAIDVPAGEPALAGKIFALRIVSFNFGDAFALGDSNTPIRIYPSAPVYRRRGGWDKLYLLPASSSDPSQLVVEASEDVEEWLDGPPTFVLADPITGRWRAGLGAGYFLPTIVAVGSPSGAAGSDLNADDYQANQTRITNWVDVSGFAALMLISNVQTLAGINGADSSLPAIHFSSTGAEAPTDAPMKDLGVGNAGFYAVGNPSTNRIYVAGRYARIKYAMGAVAGPKRGRIAWMGFPK
jgi:hypothetical protein